MATPNPFDEFDAPKAANPFDEFDAPEPSSFLRRAVADTALAAGQGVVGLGESAVGLADIPTFGRVGKALKDYTGYDPQATTQALEELKTPEQQQANRAVAEAKGFGGTLRALAQNPSVIPQKVAETIPLIAGGGAVARALPKGLSALARGAIGEGTLGAGLSAEQSRQESETGTITPTQAGLALTSGALTGAITRGAGTVANRLGVGDIEQLVAGGKLTAEQAAKMAKKGLARRTAEGALTEGVLEEAPQSAQEQALQNIALGRPAGEGVPEATAIGGTLGSVIGAGAGALPQGALPPVVPPGVVPPAVPPTPVAPDWGTTTGVFPQGQPLAPGAPPPLAPQWTTDQGVGPATPPSGPIGRALAAAPPWQTALGAGVTTTPREDVSGAYRDQEIAALLQKSEAQRVRERDFAPARAQQRAQQGEVAQARGRAEGVGEPPPETAMQRAFREAQGVKYEKEAKTVEAKKATIQGQPAEAEARRAADAAAGGREAEAVGAGPERGGGILDASAKQDAEQADAGRGAGPGAREEGGDTARGGAGVRAQDQGGEGVAGAGAQAQVDAAANEAATSPRNDLPEPTEAQQEAGNWKHGHVRLNGLDISIEHPQGSVRRGVDKGGKPWAVTMSASYGYIRGTAGKDKEHIDAYIGEHPESERTFVVDQIDPKTGRFDEHKVIMGARSLNEANALYDAHFSDGSGPTRRKAVSEVTVEDFKTWLKEGNTKAEFAGQVRKGERVPAQAQEEAKSGVQIREAITAPEAEAGLRINKQAAEKAKEPVDQPVSDVIGPKKERRTDVTRRKTVAAMSPEELRREILTDPLTRLGNRRAYDDTKKLPVQVSVDLDALKFVNDAMGHSSGDAMLRAFGEALGSETSKAYRLGGDEFVVQASTEAMGRFIMERVAKRLSGARVEVTLPDGSVVSKTGIGFSYGIGGDYAAADDALKGHKAERERSGQRPGRGAEPPGVERRAGGVAETPAEGEPREPDGAAAEETSGAVEPAGAAQERMELEQQRAEGYTGGAEAVKHFDERLGDAATQRALSAMAAHSGWETRGGELLRDADHKVIGRTKWIPRESWFAELPERLNEAATVEAVRKAIAGDALGAKERRVVGFMLDAMDRGREEGAAVAPDEEADAERAAIVDEALNALQTEDIDTLFGYDTLNDNEIEEFFGEPQAGARGTEETDAAGTPGGDRAPGEAPRPAGEPLLEAYSETDLKQREEARVATERREAEETAARLTKRDADKARAEFVLSGSDREADELAARGQQSLLDQPATTPKVPSPKEKAKRPIAKAPPTKEELKDVGEKIEGARKDLWAGRALGHQDIAGMNERELQKFVTKEHVFPRPNYQAIADHINAEFGERFDAAKQRFSEDVRVLDMGAGSALLIKKIRDSIANPPLGASRESLEDYLTAVGMVRKALEDLETFIVPTGANLVKLAFGEDIVTNERYHIWNQESPNYKYLKALGDKFARTAQVDARDWARAIIEADKTGFPKKQEVWQRDYRVFPKEDIKIGKGTKYIEGKPVDVWFVGAHEGRFIRNFPTQAEAEVAIKGYTPYLVLAKKSGNLVKQVDTEAEGINFARDTYKAQHPTAKREDKTPELQHIVREGQDYRGGRDIGDNEFKDAFGFRGVQFGNWTDQRDRQQSLNHAYDALMDLADALGVPPVALSLNGELGMAFGARGKGGFAAAHYEPTRVVINLTKTSGAGTAAHEWAHALDDYFGRLSADLAGKKSPYVSHGVSTKTAMRPEMVQAFKDVMSAINYRLQTQGEVLEAAQADIEKSAKYIASWLKRMRTELKDAERDGSGFDALAMAVQDAAGDARDERQALFVYMSKQNGRMPSLEVRKGLDNNLDWRRRYYQRLNKAMSGEAQPLKLPSTYAKLSTAKGPYWARAHELFARAFESFMLDKLAGQGRRSDYLVHPAKQAREETDPDYPYPAGAERTNINAAFEKFLAALAHKTTDKGVALYSRATGPAFGQAEGLFEKPSVLLTRLTGTELTASQAIGILRTKAAMALRGLPADGLKNKDTGWRFTVGRQDWKKIATAPGQTQAGLRAIGGINSLVEHAILAESHPDTKGNRDVVAVHRFYAPVAIGERLYRAKLTVREYVFRSGEGRKNLHALEAIEIESPDGIRLDARATQGTYPPAQPSGPRPAITSPRRDPEGSEVQRAPSRPNISIVDLLKGVVRDSDGRPFEPTAGKYSYAGERGAKVPQHALAAAREYAEQGVPMEEIRKTTGWHRAKDGLWRFELSDKDAKLKPGWDGYGLTVGETLDHPTLFENYPSLAKIDIVFRIDLPENVTGGYSSADNAIHLNANLSERRARSTLLHELQHGVQVIEGFARGGSPADAEFITAAAAMGIDTADKSAMMSAYRRLMGEVEARDVQARQKLTVAELRERPPYVSQGIPESEFIVQFKGEEAAEIATGQSLAGLRASLVRRLGARAIVGLERAGFSIIEREDQLPLEIRPKSGEAVRGVYWKGKSYLVAGSIPEGAELGVMLHEVGVHAGLEGLLGKTLYSEVIQSVKTAAKLGERNPNASPFVRAVMAAQARVPNDTRAAHVTEETLAYLIEDAANHGLPLVRRILGAIRAWLLRHGFKLKEIRPEDLVAMARASVHKLSREATVQRGPVGAPAYAAEAPTFYSEMAKFIDAKGPGKTAAAQWKVLLDGWAKAGKFKADELEWSGVREFLDLQQGPVTKGQVLGFIRENGVRVEETTLGEDVEGAAKRERLRVAEEAVMSQASREHMGRPGDYALDAARGELSEGQLKLMSDEMRPLVKALRKAYQARKVDEIAPTKFAQWQLPGGENYREVLLRLPLQPRKAGRIPPFKEWLQEQAWYQAGNAPSEHNQRALYDQWVERESRTKEPGFRSTHFDEPNILAHVRFNERRDTDNRRVLFIEEIQSDYAAALRAGKEVPKAPFVGKTESYVALILKRMIRHAAENGFEKIAFTTGEQQAERYDLSKQVNEISAKKNPDGTYWAMAVTKDDRAVELGSKLTESELEAAVGKGLTAKIVKQPVGEQRYSGLDLKVGGQGMRTFYDKIVPNVANALLKKLGGGRVGEVNLGQAKKKPMSVTAPTHQWEVLDEKGEHWGFYYNEADAKADAKQMGGTARFIGKPDIWTQPGFDLTPALRESAMRGLPLFSRRREPGAPILDSEIKVRKNGPGVRSRHKYTATLKGEGVYGFGDTPQEARDKLRELNERFERERAERQAPLYSVAAPTLPGILDNGNVPPPNPFNEENRRLREQDKTAWSRAKTFWRRNFTPGGLLPAQVFDQKIIRDNELGVVEFDSSNLVTQLEHAVKQIYGKRMEELTADQRGVLQQALTGKVVEGLDPRARTVIDAMRQHIDRMSGEYLAILEKQIADLEAAGDPLAAVRASTLRTITGNIGRYVHRSYRAFDDPLWFNKIPDDVINAARSYLRGRYLEDGMAAAEAEAKAERALNTIVKTGTAYDSMESFIREGKLGAKDLSILQRRKDIAPQIRALLGEYDDPRLNYAKSTSKMARLIWNTRFLDRVREIGMGTFLFEEKDAPAGATTKIAADSSEVYSPLNGLWTFPEIEQAFKDAVGKEKMADWYRLIVQMNGLVKYSKTVLSPTTSARNWMSAMFFSLANGHFDMRHVAKSITALRGRTPDYMRRLVQLGVVRDNVASGEIMQLMADSRIEDILADKKSTPYRMWRDVNKFAQAAYRNGDDFWKVIGFENEKAALMKVGVHEAQAETEAAERIRNTYPTYSMVGRGIKWLARFPLAGTFVSFPAEIIRTSGHMLRYVAKDYKDAKRRPLALRRAAGLAMVSGFAYALQAISMAMMGMDDDEEEAVRRLAAPWQRNSNFLFTGRDEKGQLRYFDLSFLDPYNWWKRPITAILRGQPWEDKATGALRDMLSPFLGTDITAGAIFEVLANKKESGGPVYNEFADPVNQSVAIADHLRKALQPGFVGNLERTYRAANGDYTPSGKRYDLADEGMGWIGWRVTTLEPKTALYYRSFEFADAKKAATSTLNKTLATPNDVSREAIASAKANAQRQLSAGFKDMSLIVDAAMKNGMTRPEVIRVLRTSGVALRDIPVLLSGREPKLMVSPLQIRNAVTKARAIYGETKAREIGQRYREASSPLL